MPPIGPLLGIESTCDETAAAIVHNNRVLASVVASQHDLHAEYRGVVPEIASRAHAERVTTIIQAALDQARLTLNDIHAIAVANRPGLIGCLLVGVAAAKALAWSRGLPLVGVDHVHAHLDAALLNLDQHEPADLYPALGFVASGGHTAAYRLDDPLTATRLGATIDDALGEAYDKAAAMLGLPYPGGPHVDRLAREATNQPPKTPSPELPVSRLGNDSLDFSFSGLKTALLYEIRGVPRPKREGGGFPRELDDLTDERRQTLAAAFQDAAAKTVTLKLERALRHLHQQSSTPRAIIAGGGVTANSRLRDEITALAERQGLALRLPEPQYCVDNAAMIAGLGARLLAAGLADDLALTPTPTT